MAQKELTIKINIEGQDIVLTSQQIELFKKNIIDMKKELEAMGQRTDANAEKFDKLKGDIQALEKTFGDVKEEVKDTGDATEKAGQQTQTYTAQIKDLTKQLIALGPRTAENAADFDRLQSEIKGLRDAQEDLQFGTKKLDDALAAIPGPIGQAAGAFKTFDDATKNIKSALSGLKQELGNILPSTESVKKGFKDFGDGIKNFKISDLSKGFKSLMPTLDGVKSGLLNVGKALVATGIGAIAIVVGLLVAAFVKLLATSKPLQDALGRFGVLFETIMEGIKPLVDIIANALVSALDFLAKALAFVTGNLDEYNKKLADKAATDAAKDNLAALERDFEANGDKYDKYTQKKIKADLDYQKKAQELREQFKNGEIKSQQELDRLLADFAAKRNRTITEADNERQAEADEKAKQAREKAKADAERRAQIEKDFQNRLRNLKNENTLLQITDEEQKAKKQLEIQKDTQLREINELQITEKKKQQLRDQVNANYKLNEEALNKKIAEDKKKANDDLIKANRDLATQLIDDDKERALQEAQNRKSDALKALQDSKATAEEIAKAKLLIDEQYLRDKERIEKEAARRSQDFAMNIAKQNLDNKLRAIETETITESEKIAQRGKVIEGLALQQLETDKLNLKRQLEDKKITQQEYNDAIKVSQDTYNLAIKENALKTEEDLLAARQANRDAVMMLSNSIGALGQAMGEETAAGQALIKMQQALALATTISAIADQFKGLGQAAKQPFPANIVAIATFLGTIGTAVVQFKSLFGVGPRDLAGKGGGSSGQGLGRNYAGGGVISGPGSSTSDSIPINVSNGEAVMTAGAVTMFRPMLSMMNQMGGGTSFAQNAAITRNDVAAVNNPVASKEPPIIKTYVVESELTNEQQKQARLKDLSTL